MTVAPTILWTVPAMASAMNARVSGRPRNDVTGISIDSRSIVKGEAFFAIKGDRLDGHDYVEKALAAGASVAVVDAAHAGKFAPDAALLVVDDTLEALRKLGAAARARSSAKIIAITGSVGKTGTKEALRLALSQSGETHASAASFNNHWGVPLSLARLPESARFGVFELGMNHAGEIEPLAKLVRPHVAIITTIEPVHLEYFSGIEAIADAKAEIFSGIEPHGAAVLNRDNAQFERLKAAAEKANFGRVLSFGENSATDARLIDVSLKPECSCARANILGEEVVFKIGSPGKHLVMNALAVLSAAKLAGADLAKAALALAKLAPPPGRGRRLPLNLAGGRGLLIDESYNANPASMRAALDVLGGSMPAKNGRKIAVLGDMLELGASAEKEHAGLASVIKNAGVNLVFCAGPLMASLWQALPAAQRGGYAETAALLEPQVLKAVHGGDVVMVKGSNGSRTGLIVLALIEKFGANAEAEEIIA